MQTKKKVTFNIEVDGNEGTGKTYIIKLIKQFFNNCIFKDRGIFSKATLLNKESEEKMYDYIDNNIDNDTLYIILDYFTNKIHCPYYVLNTSCFTEGYIDIRADCIIDVVETGATLEANDIKILSNIINTDTCIFEHASLMDCWLPTNIQKVYNLCKQKNN